MTSQLSRVKSIIILVVLFGLLTGPAWTSAVHAQSKVVVRPTTPFQTYANDTQYVGNDNAEFGTHGVTPTSVALQATLSQKLVFTEPESTISLQYNPDEEASYLYNDQWFQSSISANSGDCFQFTIQIYRVLGSILWSSYLPSPTECYVISDGLNSGSVWVIDEIVTGNYISSVFFSVTNPSGFRVSGTINAPSQVIGGRQGEGYEWLKSNSCWCGVDTHNADFTSGAGSFVYSSNTVLYQISPPSWIGTAESSNMEYGCMAGSGTYLMTQSFGLTGAC
jgi:hypothetical protein